MADRHRIRTAGRGDPSLLELRALLRAGSAGTERAPRRLMWPLWNILDTTPGGRGADFDLRLEYE